MNEHFAQTDVLRSMLGEATSEKREHLAACAPCAAEVQRLRSAVAGFSAAVTFAADQVSVPRMSLPAEARRESRRTVRNWSLAAAALILLLSAPLYTVSRNRQLKLQRELAAQADQAEAAFFVQVDSAVSRPVPSAMQPLVQLVSSPTASKQGESK